jgi:hypothetical protein
MEKGVTYNKCVKIVVKVVLALLIITFGCGLSFSLWPLPYESKEAPYNAYMLARCPKEFLNEQIKVIGRIDSFVPGDCRAKTTLRECTITDGFNPEAVKIVFSKDVFLEVKSPTDSYEFTGTWKKSPKGYYLLAKYYE